MLPQSYTFSHGLCLNNFFQFWFIGNQRDQVPLFRYINRDDEVYHSVIGRKVLGDKKYLMRLAKRAVGAVGSWTGDNWDLKRVNSLYTMVFGRFNFKINKRFDSLSCSLVFRVFYTRWGHIVGELNEERDQAWQARKNKR